MVYRYSVMKPGYKSDNQHWHWTSLSFQGELSAQNKIILKNLNFNEPRYENCLPSLVLFPINITNVQKNQTRHPEVDQTV